jgi:hypothetical protein
MFPTLPSGDNPYMGAAAGAAADAAGIAKKKKKKPASPGAAPGGPFDLSSVTNPSPLPQPGAGLIDSLNAATGIPDGS